MLTGRLACGATSTELASSSSINSIGVPLTFSSSYRARIRSREYLKGYGLGAADPPLAPSEVGKYEPSVGKPGETGVCVAREYDIGAAFLDAKAAGDSLLDPPDRAGKGTDVEVEVEVAGFWT